MARHVIWLREEEGSVQVCAKRDPIQKPRFLSVLTGTSGSPTTLAYALECCWLFIWNFLESSGSKNKN